MAWKKGQSGNPGGRSKVSRQIQEIARAEGEKAFRKVVSLMDSEDERIQLAAAQEILNRAYGRPVQAQEVTGSITFEQIERVIIPGKANGHAVEERTRH